MRSSIASAAVLLAVAQSGLIGCGGSGKSGVGGQSGSSATAGAGGRGGSGQAGTGGGAGTTGTAGTGGSSAGRGGASGAGGTAGATATAGTGGSSAGRGGAGGSGTSGTGGGSAGRGGAAGSGTSGAGGTAGTTGTGGGTAGTTGAGGALGPLRVDTTNPRYFNNGHGKIVYLTGSHTWGNLKDRALTDPPPAFDYAGYLNFLVARNHNFFRLWAWEQTHSEVGGGEPGLRWIAQPIFQRTGPGNANDGKPKFDLTKFDASYFSRLRQHVVDAGARGIYVSVMMFNAYDLVNIYNATDGGFPYASGNNVNGVASDGPSAVNLSNSAVTAIQESYIKQVIDTVNDLDNVLYEIANESAEADVQWQYHMITVIKQYEATKPKQHPVGMTATPGTDDELYASAADWISPLARRPVADGRKVIINDTDNSYYWVDLESDGQQAGQAWAWETLTLGSNPAFMDPYLEPRQNRNAPPNSTTLDPQWDKIRNAIGRTRIYAEKLDLAHAVPSGSLSSSNYCIAYPGNQYLVYQPTAGAAFSVTLTAGTYNVEWYDPTQGVATQAGSITATAGARAFTPPFSGDAVLFLSR